MKSSEVCIKTRSPPASLPIQGQVIKHTTVKWPTVVRDEEPKNMFSFCPVKTTRLQCECLFQTIGQQLAIRLLIRLISLDTVSLCSCFDSTPHLFSTDFPSFADGLS